MKYLFPIIFSIITHHGFGQEKTYRFQEIQYSNDGNTFTDIVEYTVPAETVLDAYLYKKHFKYALPAELTDTRYFMNTVTIRRNGPSWESTWTNTYQYDELSRLILYSFSNCIACSGYPYEFQIVYDDAGHIIELIEVNKSTGFMREEKQFSYEIISSWPDPWSVSRPWLDINAFYWPEILKRYEFEYDQQGNIVEVRQYNHTDTCRKTLEWIK